MKEVTASSSLQLQQTPSLVRQATTPASRSSDHSSLSSALHHELRTFSQSWQRSRAACDKLLLSMPKELRPLIATQQAVQDLHLKTEVVSKVAEAGAQTVKRLQQMGGA